MAGECESPGELPTSFPITSSPAKPILYMNSHSIWGALLRLVNRPLHHKKGHPQATQSLPAAFCSLPVLNDWIPLFLSRPPPLCLSRPHELPPHIGCPFENYTSSPLKKSTPKQFNACPLHFVLFPALNGPQHYMNPRPQYGVPFCVWSTGLFTIKKGTPKQLKACPLHSVPSLFSMTGSLFSYHVLPHYACLVHMNSHPISGALSRTTPLLR